MSSGIAEIIMAGVPKVVIAPWVGKDGWPCFRVFYLAPAFGATGELYLEAPNRLAAEDFANTLSACSGWPIEYCPVDD